MGFGGLYTSITGLMASRQSLDTVSHNLSNANNKNYVRQSAIHANNPYTTVGRGKLQVGTGVNVQEIRQIRDEFLDIKYRRELATFGYHNAKSQILEDVEGVFNEITNSGLQNVMDDFWDSWNELYKEPESLTNRALVHESAVAFTDTVSHISNQLNDIKQNLNKEITIKVNEINSLLNGISKLNSKIKVVEGENSKVKANDFRDERNAALDRLSALLPVKSYENTYGETTVSLFGQDLINGSYTSNIEIKNDEKGLGHIYFSNSNENINLKGLGELGGYIDVRDNSVDEYRERLDELVGAIAGKTNDLHKEAYNLEGNKDIDFFKGTGETINAGNIKVNSELSNFNKIAASSKGDKGNGDIAKAIYEIRFDEELLTQYNGNATMNSDEYYRDLTLELGLERQFSREIAENQGFLTRSIDDRRNSISSVSLDEEMADMIKFQHSYVANSRVINVIDEMLETIVNKL